MAKLARPWREGQGEHCAPLPFSFTLKGPENLVREIRTMRRKRRWEKLRKNERKSERQRERDALKLAFSLPCKKADREGTRIK